MKGFKWVLLILSASVPVLFLSLAVGHAETAGEKSLEGGVDIPFQEDLPARLEKAGLHPSQTTRVMPPKGFQLPEVPKAITRDQLGPAQSVRMLEIEQKRQAGKLTETEYNLEKDSLFRDANIQY
ncbi:MAG: hypothetical protein COW12_01080 [Candidatus Omnitrophica bacterium CG12_big_fil_rev_8_21_14_0_65_45_16]|nr:MAG: hypothetical protein COW12_01080 [Candidatus Omnitrophica bacterium CG12_big_fil_rev_8_21_14_0_65_45_16]